MGCKSQFNVFRKELKFLGSGLYGRPPSGVAHPNRGLFTQRNNASFLSIKATVVNHNINMNLKKCYSELIEKLRKWSLDTPGHVALVNRESMKNSISSQNAPVYHYDELFRTSQQLALYLLERVDNLDNSDNRTIGVFLSSVYSNSSSDAIPITMRDSDYVLSMLATWMIGKAFVPLCSSHSAKEIQYFATDSDIRVIIHNLPESALMTSPLAGLGSSVVLIDINDFMAAVDVGRVQGRVLKGQSLIEEDRRGSERALVVYTSGTTGQPKGVLHTHRGLSFMMLGLVESWKYCSDDVILHFLPLHHIHGILNKLLCVLYAGGTVSFLESASPRSIWSALSSPSPYAPPPTIFMAVPTVYGKLLESVGALPEQERLRAISALRAMRLHVSGSAALPDSIMNGWLRITGHVLLERYGMTELGMILGNPYEGRPRVVGSVGFPMPHVEVRIVDDGGVVVDSPNIPGELRVKGPTVFEEYLNRPQVTAEAFDAEGWFKTGDIAIRTEDNYYKLLGRSSSDIIKRGGYKLSALEIERELLSHPQVLEAVVVGAKDELLGEKVVALITLREQGPPCASSSLPRDQSLIGADVSVVMAVNRFLADKLAPYKRPEHVLVVSEIPRNHMGKVNKKTLLRDLSVSIS